MAGDALDVLSEGKSTNDTPTANNAPIPWYLQVETPRAPLNPISDRQRLPDLPVDPPPILEPLLKYVSIDLGMDDLSLFDLRALDPPPALGTNLLMVIGTARSERHLHVSADRFCRWLRSSHHLTPFPDGLLGRNELKLKMRRKARRAKLIGTVGASPTSNPDDGIRTGWVCVNVGTVDSGRPIQEETAEAVGFVGFGSKTAGVKVVVQMLTEEKRGELDLEEIWGGMLRRQARRDSQSSQIEHEQTTDEVVGLNADITAGMTSDFSHSATSRSLRLKLPTHGQTRTLHSSSRIRAQNTDDGDLIDYYDLDPASVEPKLQSNPPILSTEGLHSKLASGRTQEATLPADDANGFGDVASLLSLQAHLRYLRSLPRGVAIEALGSDSNDRSSTEFLASFYNTLSKARRILQRARKIDLICCGVEFGHPGYPISILTDILAKKRASNDAISYSTLLKLLKTTLLRKGPNDILGQRGHDSDITSSADIIMVKKLLEELKHRGSYYLPEEIAILLQEAMCILMPLGRRGRAKPLLNNQSKAYSNPTAASEYLMNLIGAFTTNYTSDDSYIRMMRLCAEQGRWDKFWEFWRYNARCMRPRSGALYAHMFRTMAETKHQVDCMHCLREWVPEMEREVPPVRLDGDVAKAVMDCLLVAEPNVVAEARSNPKAPGEWVPVWIRCEMALQNSLDHGCEEDIAPVA